MKLSALLVSTVAACLAAAQENKKLVPIDLPEPYNWVVPVGDPMWKDLIIGYEVTAGPDSVFTEDSWSEYMLTMCRTNSECTTLVTLQRTDVRDTTVTSWFGFAFRGPARNATPFRRDESTVSNVRFSKAWTI